MTISRIIGLLTLGMVCCRAVSSDAQTIPPPAGGIFAYTTFYCSGEACDYYPPLVSGTVVATPFTQTQAGNDALPTWSPDASRIAYYSSGDIVVMDTTGALVNITNSAAWDWGPAWSPDGQRIAFASDRDGQAELYMMTPDGSNVVRVTANVGFVWSRPAWSADATRLAFTCEVNSGNRDICAINLDGTGFQRLTDDPAGDNQPSWSPDGHSIAFVTGRYGGYPQLAIMAPDGSGVSRLGNGISGWQPAWSPDGRLLAFTAEEYSQSVFGVALYTVARDGSDMRLAVPDADDAAWIPTFSGLAASFGTQCSGMTLTCSFDASSSIGTISDYAWTFGDGTTGSGSVVNHTYADGGNMSIALQVTDDRGISASQVQTIHVNRRPVASFTVSCDSALTCVLDWSASYDPDGYVTGITWRSLGGTATITGYGSRSITVTYATPGVYTATLEVSDDLGATATTGRTFTVTTPQMHVGDLDASVATQHGPSTAAVTIAVHNSNHDPLASATVTATWNDGAPASCTTTLSGSCVISRSINPSKKTLSLRVASIAIAPFAYAASSNHDPDGDSDGTAITIVRR